MTCDDADHDGFVTSLRLLISALRADTPIPAGRLLGLPELPENDVWVDVAGAAALTQVKPKTITSWLARGGPVRAPFPKPYRLLYRLYSKRSDLEQWRRRSAP